MPSSVQAPLEQAAAGLLFPSESEFPFTYVEWPDCRNSRLSTSAFLQLVGKPEDTPVEKKSLEELFEPLTREQDWYGDEEKATVQRFLQLQKTIAAQLERVRAYRVGKIEIEIYIVGATPEGYWAGLSTKAIET